MKHPVTRELFSYWDTLRAERTAPERAEIDPAAIRDALPYTFMLEIGPRPGALRDVTVRLSGTRLNALFMTDLKGRRFLDLWDACDAADVSSIVETVLDDRLAVVACTRTAPPGCEPVEGELLLAPLRHYGKTHARILGSLAATRSPSWLGLYPTAPLALASFRTVSTPARTDRSAAPCPSPDRAPLATRDAPMRRQGDALPPSPVSTIRPRTGEASRVGRFRVYEGGRGADPLATGSR